MYVCQFRANQVLPEHKYIYICITENMDSRNTTDYIQLNPTAANGYYRIIDNKIHLGLQTAEHLFKALGCKVEFDQEQTVMIIYK